MPAANQSQYAPHSTPRAMTIKVSLVNGRRFEYQGVFAHTFDAYDDAMDRHGADVARISVTVTPPQAAQVAA